MQLCVNNIDVTCTCTLLTVISVINPKLYEKTCYWLLVINLAKLTVHYNKYEYVWDRLVYGNYGIQVYSIR